jgi:hypothetical protein
LSVTVGESKKSNFGTMKPRSEKFLLMGFAVATVASSPTRSVETVNLNGSGCR